MNRAVIKTCLFDMGNVLVHFSHQKMCENVSVVCGIDTTEASEVLLQSGLQWELERGEISEDQFHQTVQKKCGKTIDRKTLLHAAADIFWLNESIAPLLAELKQLGIRLVLLSNTSITHLEFIRERFAILDDFDDFATSFEAGALKPDDPIFDLAIAKAKCEPECCFYTDDIEEYIIKGRTRGLNAEVYTTAASTRASLIALGVPIES